MIFFYSPEAGAEKIILEQEEYHYLVRVRRHRVGDILDVQDMKTPKRFSYRIEEITKKSIVLILVDTQEIELSSLSLHLAWAMCDASTIYNTLPALNQLGVKKITFLETERSQKNIRLNPEKIKNICINSSQQCGRNHLLEWEISSFSTFVHHHPHAICFDMSGSEISLFSQEKNHPCEYLIGAEGGWSNEELALINPKNLKKMNTPFVMKSEIAAIAGSILFFGIK